MHPFNVNYNVDPFYRKHEIHKHAKALIEKHGNRIHNLFPIVDNIHIEILLMENPGIGQVVHPFYFFTGDSETISFVIYKYVDEVPGFRFSDLASAEDVEQTLTGLFKAIIDNNSGDVEL